MGSSQWGPFHPPSLPLQMAFWSMRGHGWVISLASGLVRGSKAPPPPPPKSFPASGSSGDLLGMFLPWLAGWLRRDWEVKWLHCGLPCPVLGTAWLGIQS